LKFSTRTLYGLKAILALAVRYGEGSLSVSQIAKKEGISVAYLEQILNALKKKGLVKSVRGPQGGYVLAQKPSDLTLEQLFYSIESRSLPEKNPPAQAMAGKDEVSVGSALFWEKFSASLREGLSKSSLKDLVDEARRVQKNKLRASSHTFHI
jgi:Rrf2 family protein